MEGPPERLLGPVRYRLLTIGAWVGTLGILLYLLLDQAPSHSAMFADLGKDPGPLAAALFAASRDVRSVPGACLAGALLVSVSALLLRRKQPGWLAPVVLGACVAAAVADVVALAAIMSSWSHLDEAIRQVGR